MAGVSAVASVEKFPAIKKIAVSNDIKYFINALLDILIYKNNSTEIDGSNIFSFNIPFYWNILIKSSLYWEMRNFNVHTFKCYEVIILRLSNYTYKNKG